MKEIKLRPHQEQAVKDLRIALSKGRHQILAGVCSFGKTVVAAYMIRRTLEQGKKVLFIVDRIILSDQCSRTLDKYNIPHSIVQGDNPRYDPSKLCQIASGATLRNRPMPDDVALVIEDEAHVMKSVMDRVRAYNPDAFYVGLSATPWSKGLGKKWAGVVKTKSVQQLTDEGYLAPLRYFAKSSPDLSNVKTVMGDYNKKQLEEATDKPQLVADVVTTWLELGENRQTICFATSISHAKHLALQFQAKGVNAVHLDCYTDTEARNEAYEGFRTERIKMLIAVALLSVGFDESIASCVILARATKSKMLFFQMTGRVQRIHDGKVDGLVLDHGNNTERHGFISDEQDYTLDDGTHAKNSKQKERKEPLPKACPKCGYIKPASTHKCPSCGFAPEKIESPDFESGELVELKRAKKARKEFTLQQKREFLAGLNKYAHEKGFRRGKKGVYGWAIHQFTEKFGCSPSNKIQWGAIGTITPEVTGWVQHQAIARRYGSHK